LADTATHRTAKLHDSSGGLPRQRGVVKFPSRPIPADHRTQLSSRNLTLGDSNHVVVAKSKRLDEHG